MKKLLRKNQIIITALVVMVAMAGYLSMTEKDEYQMKEGLCVKIKKERDDSLK